MAEVLLNLIWSVSALLALLSVTVVSILVVHRFFRNRLELRAANRRKELRRLAVHLVNNPEQIIEARKLYTDADRRLLLTVFEEMSQAEAAMLLGISAKAVVTRVYRAKALLARRLTRDVDPRS